MILQVGKKYVARNGSVYTIISTNRKGKDGRNVVAEDPLGRFFSFKTNGHFINDLDEHEYDLVKEYKPRLKVQFTIDLPEHLQGLSMDEIDSAMLDRIRGCSFCDRENLSNIEVICSYEN